MSVRRPPDPAPDDRRWIAAYPPGVPPTYRLPDVTVPRFLDDAVRDFPDAEAVVAGPVRLDHATLHDHVGEVEAVLRAAGVRGGDRVLVALPNLATLPIVLLAVWHLGAIAVPVAVQIEHDRVLAIAVDAGLRAVVAPLSLARGVIEALPEPTTALVVDDDRWLQPPRWRRRATPARRARTAARRLRGMRIPGTDGAWPQMVHLADALGAVTDRADASGDGAGRVGPVGATTDQAAATTDAPEPSGAVGAGASPADEVALLAYEDRGGEPHGVELTHRNLVASSFACRLWIPDVQAGRERVLIADPVVSPAVLALGVLPALLAAATVVLLDEPDAAGLVRAVDRHHPTLLPVTARRLPALVDASGSGRRALGSLRVVLAIGDLGERPLDPRVALELERLTGGARVRTGAGTMLTGPLAVAQPVYGRVVPGTLGLPVTDVLAVLVDLDEETATEASAAVDEVGVLAVDGPQVPRGIWRRPGAAAVSPTDGWVVTDQLVRMDGDGMVHHIGRRGDVVERTGQLVDPQRTEAVLEAHPGVRRAGVVGIAADGRLLAAVVPRPRAHPTADELLVHCRAHLDSPAVPDHVTMVEELPETEAGDLAREVLRERLAGAGGEPA